MLLNGRKQVNLTCTGYLSCERKRKSLLKLHHEKLTGDRAISCYRDEWFEKNMKIAVIVVWITASSYGVLRMGKVNTARYLTGPLAISCILFLTFAYLIMYRETARHKEKIKTQQLPQEDVERFLKENKALKTTLFVAGAVLVCLLPAGFFLLLQLRASVIFSQ